MHTLLKVALFYFAWITLHYAASHLYTNFCVPWTLRGFLLAPLVAPGPHCVALRWAIQTGGETINLMWVVIASAVLSMIKTPQ